MMFGSTGLSVALISSHGGPPDSELSVVLVSSEVTGLLVPGSPVVGSTIEVVAAVGSLVVDSVSFSVAGVPFDVSVALPSVGVTVESSLSACRHRTGQRRRSHRGGGGLGGRRRRHTRVARPRKKKGKGSTLRFASIHSRMAS
jgi:hypothetical protein